MKKIFFVFLAVSICTASSFASQWVNTPLSADEYFIDDQQIELLFDKSTDISLTALQTAPLIQSQSNLAANNAFYAPGDKNFITALLLNFFLGGLGIHRAYLGTKTLTWVGYILTCGGIVGIVPLVDFITLIINNDDLSPYIDNPKFFMWGGGGLD